MILTITAVGSRYKLGKAIKSFANDKEYGLITNVKLTRISFTVWHLQFDVEARVK